MSRFNQRASELRNDGSRHINCAQAVLLTFAPDFGLDEETANRLSACFGSGMRMGDMCGAITGALMVLGLAGADDQQASAELIRSVKEHHDGMIYCRDLLRRNAELNQPKKVHCDGMVYECVELTEKILRDRGLIRE